MTEAPLHVFRATKKGGTWHRATPPEIAIWDTISANRRHVMPSGCAYIWNDGAWRRWTGKNHKP